MLRTCRKAATLPELLVYTTLFILVLGMVYASLLSALNAYHSTRNFAEVQQQALTVGAELSEELARSPSDRVVVEPNAIVFLSPTDVTYDSSGKVIWKKWVCYYRTPANELRRKELPLTPPTSDVAALVVPAAGTLIGDAALPSRLVARNILEFTAAGGSFTVLAGNDERGIARVSVTTATTFRP